MPTADVYRQIFVDFCRAELATGGPDPQVRLFGSVIADRTDLSDSEKAFRCGLFVAPYTVGAGALLSYLRDVEYPREHWGPFLIQHKEGFPMRRERRAVWGDDRVKLMRCINSWDDFSHAVLPDIVSGECTYDDLYKAINKHAVFFGRYAAMKVIETMLWAGLAVPPQDSIVAKGAKYPRKMLARVFPEYAEQFNSKSNDIAIIDLANGCALEAAGWIGQGVTWFQLETLLCNSRQSLDGKYAGRSHDRELAHWRKANGYFKDTGIDLRTAFPFYPRRAELFPTQYLGERGDPAWWGSREELEKHQKAVIKHAMATH